MDIERVVNPAENIRLAAERGVAVDVVVVAKDSKITGGIEGTIVTIDEFGYAHLDDGYTRIGVEHLITKPKKRLFRI